MICTDKKMATRVAFIGANKMAQEAYRYERVGGSWLMTTPSGDKTYWVSTKDARGNALCDCAFFAANKEFGICKHIARALQLEKDAQEQAERDAEEDGYWIRMYDNGEGPEGCVDHPHVPGLGF